MFCFPSVMAGLGIYENNLRLPLWAPNFPVNSRNRYRKQDAQGNADSSALINNPKLATLDGLDLVVSSIRIDAMTETSSVPIKELGMMGPMLQYIMHSIGGPRSSMDSRIFHGWQELL